MSRFRGLYRKSLAFLLTMILAIPALADKNALPTCPPRPIVMALFEMGHFYRDGVGLDKDISEYLTKHSGCRFELQVMQRQNIWQGMQDGTLDMTLSALAPPERMLFSWNVPYLWLKYVVILRKEVDPLIRSKTDFIATPQLRLGTGRSYVHGHSYDDFVVQLRNIGRVVEVDDTDRLYKMFMAGRFQAVISSQMMYDRYLKDDILAGSVRVEDWSPGKPKDEVNLLISKKNFDQTESKKWGELIKTMSSDGTLLQLLSKYVGQDAAAKMLVP